MLVSGDNERKVYFYILVPYITGKISEKSNLIKKDKYEARIPKFNESNGDNFQLTVSRQRAVLRSINLMRARLNVAAKTNNSHWSL